MLQSTDPAMLLNAVYVVVSSSRYMLHFLPLPILLIVDACSVYVFSAYVVVASPPCQYEVEE